MASFKTHLTSPNYHDDDAARVNLLYIQTSRDRFSDQTEPV